MLKPGGVLCLRDIIFSCDLHEVEAVIETWLNHASTTSELGWTRTELQTHLREECSTFSWMLELIIERAGFAIQRTYHDASRLYSVYICFKNG